MGATPKDLEAVREQFRQRARNLVVEVWPENWRAWELFCAAATQWDVLAVPAGLGGAVVRYRGINYSRLADLRDRLLPADPRYPDPAPRDLFRQLQLLEATALPMLNG